MMKHQPKLLALFTAGLSILFVFLSVFATKLPQDIREHAASNFPHVVGNQILDGNGNVLIFHGAQLEGMLNGNSPQVIKNYSQIVTVMARDWHMNAIRLPSCNWFWKADPAGYMNRIQTAVAQGNQAGLYVIIDLHDDHNCNPPYLWPEPYHLPRPQMDTYWTAVATAFKNNPMVLFDVYNEPNILSVPAEQYTDAQWKLWLSGGTVQDPNGTETFLGMQQLVNAIRQTGAQQILMVEGYASAGTFHNIGNNFVNDPLQNIVYEAHKYSMLDGPSQWDTDFGFMGTNYPVFVGEWGLLGGDNSGQTNCGSVTSPAQADQAVAAFLSYMESHRFGWTAYSIDPEHLVIDNTNFVPTTFFPGWVCPPRGTNTINHAGMGLDVKNYLLHTIPSITTQPSTTPSTTTSPSPTPPARSTTFLVTVCPHGLGNCGDNVNPNSGNASPKHQTRNLTLQILDGNNQQVASTQGTIIYNTSSQNFQGSVSIANIPTGQYIATVKLDEFLSKQIPGIISVTQNQTINLPSVFVVTGDVNNDDQLDLLDYNIIISCFGSKQNTPSCTIPPTQISPGADITDDGIVDGVDYNEFLRELSVQKGL